MYKDYKDKVLFTIETGDRTGRGIGLEDIQNGLTGMEGADLALALTELVVNDGVVEILSFEVSPSGEKVEPIFHSLRVNV